MRVFFLIIVFISSVYSQNMKIFKDFYYGMSKDEIKKRVAPLFDCSKDLKTDALCLEKYPFLDEKMSIAFVFYKNKLERVVLLSPYVRERYWKILGVFGKKFLLLGAQSPKGRVDIIEEVKRGREKEVQGKIAYLEHSMMFENKPLTYFFIDQPRCMKKNALKKVRNVQELLEKADPMCREIDVIVSLDGIAILFLLPKRSLAAISQTKLDEDF